MDGFGNVSGFSTKFGGTPQGIIDQMRSYENVYGEQLGQPALNNIKAPEIEAYKNALTESPDFEPFMQQRQRILDLAAKAQGAGININNPRTQDEVQFSMLFNQELANYERLGRALEEQRKGYEQLVGKVGTQGLVVAPTATGRYGLGDITESVSQVLPMEQVSTFRRGERFATQEAADEYTRGSEKIRQAFLEQGMDEKNPNLQRAIRNYYQIANALIQDGVFDADKAAELAVNQTKAQASLITATKKGGDKTPPSPQIDVWTPVKNALEGSDWRQIKSALDFIGLENFPITTKDNKQLTPTNVIPLVNTGTNTATGKVIFTTDQTLQDKMNQGLVMIDGNKLKKKAGTTWVDYTASDGNYRIENARNIEGIAKKSVLSKPYTFEAFRLGRTGGIDVEATLNPQEQDVSEGNVNAEQFWED